MAYPKTFQDLIESFKSLPGVGYKTAERYAYAFLEKSPEQVESFINDLNNSIISITKCSICGNLADSDKCMICQSKRNTTTLCVVASPKDVITMENTNEYHGLYHVLNGLISPSKGILPTDLNIDSLIPRLDGVNEIIIATDFTIEGETTALYLSKILSDKDILVTRIAYGLPIGSHLDYTDDLTLIKALEGRKKI